ncbi:MAG: hypothetical protein WCI94_02500, partial [Rhodospirillales bacterium]
MRFISTLVAPKSMSGTEGFRYFDFDGGATRIQFESPSIFINPLQKSAAKHKNRTAPVKPR